jgi:hypothetical protein
VLTAEQYERLVIALSDERDQWARLMLESWRDGYAAALDSAVNESLARVWPDPRYVSEIERARWGPGGRARFADHRPGDFRGRGSR